MDEWTASSDKPCRKLLALAHEWETLNREGADLAEHLSDGDSERLILGQLRQLGDMTLSLLNSPCNES